MKLRRVVGWTALLLGVALAAALTFAWFASDNDCGRAAAAAGGERMRAVIRCEYGGPAALKVEELARPVPKEDELLVRVRAAGLNPLDWHLLRGTPYVMRLGVGLRKPSAVRLGVDFAGTVEAVGRGVSRFKPGDAVFGGRDGALADYVVVRESRAVAAKPENVGFDEAAGMPIAAVTALQALRDQGKLRAGEKVLVNGASGGVGTFAVQLAKSMGARVTGVTSARNLELVRGLGADHVIDYGREDFTRGEERYDLIVDNVGNHGLLACRRALTPAGRYVMVGGPSGRWLDPLPRVLEAAALSRLGSQELRFFLAKLEPGDLELLRELAAAGKVNPVVDRRYRLDEVQEAMRYLETGRARGKVIVTME